MMERSLREELRVSTRSAIDYVNTFVNDNGRLNWFGWLLVANGAVSAVQGFTLAVKWLLT